MSSVTTQVSYIRLGYCSISKSLWSISHLHCIGNFFFAAPPTIVKFPENGIVLAEKGDEVSLSCVGEGKPEPVITWTRVVCMHTL